MAIIVSTPDAFFDTEPWGFDLTVNELDGSGPMNLTDSRLYAIFKSLSDGTTVGECDTELNDGSLTILDGPAGRVRFRVPNECRMWRLPVCTPGGLMLRSTVIGDLHRLPPGSDWSWEGIARIEVPVLPSTGLPR